VLVSAEDYAAMREDSYLLRSPANARRLLKAYQNALGNINVSERELIEDVKRDPFTGLGKPEPLKYHLPGAWSRRIDDEHRLAYLATAEQIVVLAARYHY
jgi:toxin YoeB